MRLLYLLVVLNIVVGLCVAKVVHNLSLHVQRFEVRQ